MNDSPANLFSNLPAALPEELIETLWAAGEVRVERIVSRGHASPPEFWYDQTEHEWVLLLKGAARLEFEDKTVELAPGDYLDIPPHVRHRVAWTAPDEPTIWLAVFRDPIA